ncbi:DUF397 domain-containing protein [Nonomuraea ferruginea]
MDDLNRATWRKSSRSGPDGGDCVEVAELSGGRRGSATARTPPDQPSSSPPGEWAAFISGVKDGEFD